MSAYVPKVGDRVRATGWTEGYLDVSYVGERFLIGVDERGVELPWEVNDDWIKVEPRPELPEAPNRWAPASADRVMFPAYRTADEAIDTNRDSGVIAAVEYAPTGNVVWRDEIEARS